MSNQTANYAGINSQSLWCVSCYLTAGAVKTHQPKPLCHLHLALNNFVFVVLLYVKRNQVIHRPFSILISQIYLSKGLHEHILTLEHLPCKEKKKKKMKKEMMASKQAVKSSPCGLYNLQLTCSGVALSHVGGRKLNNQGV